MCRRLSRRRRRTNGTAAEQAFETLYQQSYLPLLRASTAITLDLEVAREITHEAFTRLWERRNRLAADSNEKAWLMRVTVNLAISHRRGMLARLRHRSPASVSPDPAGIAITRLEGEKMRQALLTLRPRERAVLALRYGRDLSFAEISSILGQPEGTVRTLSHRALEKLRVRLSDWVAEETMNKTHNPDLVVKV